MTLLLIKETAMAWELTRYAEAHGYTQEQTDALIEKAAENAIDYHSENWWITKALQDNAHKELDLSHCFDWDDTEEGDGYWREIYRFVGKLPKVY